MELINKFFKCQILLQEDVNYERVVKKKRQDLNTPSPTGKACPYSGKIVEV